MKNLKKMMRKILGAVLLLAALALAFHRVTGLIAAKRTAAELEET